MPDEKCSWGFEQEVLPHLDAAYNLARWLTRNERDAQDVVQEAYARAFRFFGAFRGENARAWVLRIVRNTCYNWLQENRPLQSAAEFDENLFGPDTRTLNPEEALLKDASDKMLRAALERLPLIFRDILILREFEGMSYREIAEVTGMPPGTVMSRLSRARDGLRQSLANLPKPEALSGSTAIGTLGFMIWWPLVLGVIGTTDSHPTRGLLLRGRRKSVMQIPWDFGRGGKDADVSRENCAASNALAAKCRQLQIVPGKLSKEAAQR